jgi:hypothetical protein
MASTTGFYYTESGTGASRDLNQIFAGMSPFTTNISNVTYSNNAYTITSTNTNTTNQDTITFNAKISNATIQLIGGGGGGTQGALSHGGKGGNAGIYVEYSDISINIGTYFITIGGGGVGGTGGSSGSGGSTSFLDYTTAGGDSVSGNTGGNLTGQNGFDTSPITLGNNVGNSGGYGVTEPSTINLGGLGGKYNGGGGGGGGGSSSIPNLLGVGGAGAPGICVITFTYP